MSAAERIKVADLQDLLQRLEREGLESRTMEIFRPGKIQDGIVALLAGTTNEVPAPEKCARDAVSIISGLEDEKDRMKMLELMRAAADSEGDLLGSLLELIAKLEKASVEISELLKVENGGLQAFVSLGQDPTIEDLLGLVP